MIQKIALFLATVTAIQFSPASAEEYQMTIEVTAHRLSQDAGAGAGGGGFRFGGFGSSYRSGYSAGSFGGVGGPVETDCLPAEAAYGMCLPGEGEALLTWEPDTDEVELAAKVNDDILALETIIPTLTPDQLANVVELVSIANLQIEFANYFGVAPDFNTFATQMHNAFALSFNYGVTNGVIAPAPHFNAYDYTNFYFRN